jgi:hypothetical protein
VRTDRYADAIHDIASDHAMWIGDDGKPLDYLPERATRISEFVYEAADAVMAVADAEQAELRAALHRVRALADAFADDGLSRHGGNIAWHIEEAIANETGDFPDAAHQRIASQRARAEAAEAKVERVEALHRKCGTHTGYGCDECNTPSGDPAPWPCETRAALDDLA